MMMLFRRFVARVLILCVAGMGLPLPAQAGMIATDALGAERARIVELIDRADVQAQLQARGVSPAEVKARVAALTDAEAADLATRLGSLPAGGDIGLLGAVVLIFLVLLITDILGFTKIFPFTRPAK